MGQLQALESRLQRFDVPVGAGHVTWRCAGSGPPLVLLHGGHGSWAHWVRNIDALAQRFRVCVPDLPGYGDSSTPAANTLDALVSATRQSLDQLVGADTEIRLAGFSFGGLVAAQLARERGSVERLALFGPAGHGGARRPRAALLSWRDAALHPDPTVLRDLMRHNLEAHMLAGPADEVALQVHTQACLRTRFHSKRISQGGGLADMLRALACPVLLAWGEHDVTATPTTLAPALAAACRQAQVRIVPGAGHWLPFEAAPTVNALLMDGWEHDAGAPAG